MTFTFRPAVRENVGLLIGLAGASGSGKTFTAMRLAKGIAGDRPFAVIDTEAGRAKHYADLFTFDHGDLTPPFSPGRYADAIAAADEAKYPVIVVDSMSHEHSGVGGLLDMQEEEFKRMGSRESAKMASWIRPKGEHRRMVARLLQVRSHLILCFRAAEKIEMVKGSDGKMEVRKKHTATGLDGWVPECERTLPYELTASFLLLPAHPGVPLPIKLQEQHRALFPLDQPITEESGKRLAEWAKGGSSAPTVAQPTAPSGAGQMSMPEAPSAPRQAAEQPADDRAALVGKITGAADKAGLTASARIKLRDQYLSKGADMTRADPAALQDLLDAIRALTPSTAA